MLLAMAERRLGVAERLARCFPDRRDSARITHTLADMIRARIFAIGCGYEDAGEPRCFPQDSAPARRSAAPPPTRAKPPGNSRPGRKGISCR